MKKIIMNFSPFVILAVAMALSSFDDRPGAHSFQVLVDDKMVIDRYVDRTMKAPLIQIGKEEKKIEVRYNECGRTVSGRTLTAKDKNDSVLKVWEFEGTASGLKDAMSCPLNEIRSLAANHGNEVRIYYASNDFPQGLHIFSAAVGNSAVASGN